MSAQNFLRTWMDNENDLTKDQACALWQNHQFKDGEFDTLWQQLLDQKLIALSSSSKFNLTPDGAQLAQKSNVRFPKSQGVEAVSQLVGRINAWNELASTRAWPTVAALAVWGSLAKHTSTCSDADVALIWRKSRSQPVQGSVNPDLQDLLNALSPTSNSMEIEEKAEAWLSDIPLISLSGVDQWPDLRELDPEFSSALVWTDPLWGTSLEKEGLKDWEHAIMQTANSSWDHAPDLNVASVSTRSNRRMG